MLATTKCPLVGEGFSLISPKLLDRYPTKVPRRPGVYAIFLRNGDRLLDEIGYGKRNRAAPWRIADFVHLYTGESGDLRGRLLQHLYGEADESCFRLTLLSLAASGTTLLDREPNTDLDALVKAHLYANALIAFRRGSLIGDTEEEIVRRSGSALNIKSRKPDEFTRFLRQERKRLKQDLRSLPEKMSLA